MSQAEVAELVDLLEDSYRRLVDTLALFSEEHLDFAPQGYGNTVRGQIMHSCYSDLLCLNLADGGSRPLPEERVGKRPNTQELRGLIEETRTEVLHTLRAMSEEELRREVHVPWAAGPRSAFWLMMHTLRHIHYHLGQLTTYAYLLGLSKWQPGQ